MLKFSIIIPVYNEERAIGSLLKECILAKTEIIKKTFIKRVEIIVVNDGSNDGSSEIIHNFKNKVKIVNFKENKGYGAALKAGFKVASGDFMSFLDGDGTCDPLFLIFLLRKLAKEDADIIVGNRLNSKSRMPLTRKIGNYLFADLISFLTQKQVGDATSGMRILRSEVFSRFDSLPDGLNFTLAISCEALLRPNIKIIEAPIVYKERKGKSKLNIMSDGLLFLKTIVRIIAPRKSFQVFVLFIGLSTVLLFLIFIVTLFIL